MPRIWDPQTSEYYDYSIQDLSGIKSQDELLERLRLQRKYGVIGARDPGMIEKIGRAGKGAWDWVMNAEIPGAREAGRLYGRHIAPWMPTPTDALIRSSADIYSRVGPEALEAARNVPAPERKMLRFKGELVDPRNLGIDDPEPALTDIAKAALEAAWENRANEPREELYKEAREKIPETLAGMLSPVDVGSIAASGGALAAARWAPRLMLPLARTASALDVAEGIAGAEDITEGREAQGAIRMILGGGMAAMDIPLWRQGLGEVDAATPRIGSPDEPIGVPAISDQEKLLRLQTKAEVEGLTDSELMQLDLLEKQLMEVPEDVPPVQLPKDPGAIDIGVDPNRYWHVTNEANAPGIMERGFDLDKFETGIGASPFGRRPAYPRGVSFGHPEDKGLLDLYTTGEGGGWSAREGLRSRGPQTVMSAGIEPKSVYDMTEVIPIEHIRQRYLDQGVKPDEIDQLMDGLLSEVPEEFVQRGVIPRQYVPEEHFMEAFGTTDPTALSAKLREGGYDAVRYRDELQVLDPTIIRDIKQGKTYQPPHEAPNAADLEAWKQSQRDLGFPDEDIEEAVAQSLARKIDPTMSDTLHSLDDHMTAIDPDIWVKDEIQDMFGPDIPAPTEALPLQIPDKLSWNDWVKKNYPEGLPKKKQSKIMKEYQNYKNEVINVEPPKGKLKELRQRVDRPKGPKLNWWDRTAKPIVDNLKKAVPEVGARVERYVNTRINLASQWLWEAQARRKMIGRADEDLIIKWLEDPQPKAPLPEHLQDHGKFYQELLDSIHKKLQESGIDIAYRQNYFPHKFEDQTFLKTAQLLLGRASLPSPKSGHLLARLKSAKGYVKRLSVIEAYADEMARVAAARIHFGKSKRWLNKAMKQYKLDEKTASWVEKNLRRIVRPTEDAYSRFHGNLRRVHALIHLPSSALRQFGQTSNTIAYGGFQEALNQWWQLAKSMSYYRGKKFAAGKAGALRADDVADMLNLTQRKFLMDPGFMWGMPTADRLMRIHAYSVGEALSVRAANGDKVAEKLLREAHWEGGFDKPSRVGRYMSDLTQFKSGQAFRPGWTASELGKYVTQYKNFAYHQTRFTHQLLKDGWTSGNWKPLARMLIVTAVAQEVVLTAINLLRTNNPFIDQGFENADPIEKFARIAASRRVPITSPHWRIIQNVTNGAFTGLAADLMQFGSQGVRYPQSSTDILTGPVIGSALDAMQAGFESAAAGDVKPIGREAVGHFSAFPGGKQLREELFPKKRKKSPYSIF